jgi:hypothetical protein
MLTRIQIIAAILMTALYIPAHTHGMVTERVSDTIVGELYYLLSFVGNKKKQQPFMPEHIKHVLDFVASPAKDDTRYHAGKIKGAPSAYYAIDVRRNLAQVLKLAYHPEIPSVITSPATIRLGRWKKINGSNAPLPKLWELLPKLKNPFLLTGVEYLVNSPDTYSGAYYDYDLDRTLILFKHKGRNVFISLSKQKGLSGVGKKGLIVGPDENWDYIYSGRPGVTKAGLGWVRSYMYDSYSIAFYYELDAASPLMRFAVFKWVRAGYKKVNFVRTADIYNGAIRFSRVFKEVLESSDLPDTADLVQACTDIQKLSNEQLREIAGAYLKSVEDRSLTNRLLSKRQIDEWINGQQYLNSLSREEMQALTMVEYLKQLLGKNRHRNLTYLPISSQPTK